VFDPDAPFCHNRDPCGFYSLALDGTGHFKWIKSWFVSFVFFFLNSSSFVEDSQNETIKHCQFQTNKQIQITQVPVPNGPRVHLRQDGQEGSRFPAELRPQRPVGLASPAPPPATGAEAEASTKAQADTARRGKDVFFFSGG
jgi:hypothetical protein